MVIEDDPVALLDGKQQRRMRNFFLPLLLLESIHECCNQRTATKAADAPPNPNQCPEARFRTFVNKLAHICDYRPKGDTVTALTVLLENGRVLYLFVSNQRNRPTLNKTKQNLIALLDTLKHNLESETRVPDAILNDRLLRQVLLMNTVRVRSYLDALSKSLKACIRTCEADNATPDSTDAIQALGQLLRTIPETGQSGQKSDEFITSTLQCIQIIQGYRRLPLQYFIEKQAYNSERLKTASCWSILQHVAGRLLSYQYDVETLISAHHIWGDTDLFREFDVDYLFSSNHYPSTATKQEPESVENIIKRIPGLHSDELNELMKHAKELQVYNLDGELEKQCKRKIDPIVHAEVLLHDWLSRSGGVQPQRFFNNWRYIGTSKPICRLCQYYFFAIATPVRFRDGHPNTYLNWRPPDLRIREGQSEEEAELAKTQWLDIIDHMKARVHADVQRLLVEKTTDKKQNDSNTYTDRITLDGLMSSLGL